MKRSGYTLLEILVVIAVIAVIAGIAMVSFAGVQKEARDTRRSEDLNRIALAMEQYFTVCGLKYPTPDVGKVPTSINCLAPIQNFMSTVPTDPKSSLRYDMTGTGTSYSICAPNTPLPLENDSVTTFCRPSSQ